ncbi:hypothetical protein GCM10010249_12870 [Streptomyces roseolilacinus]|uniref:Uncharacterized protein n=1 Tax=Streptomyces roseolilacinus TaxID=66904 RepID=A0A918AX33_9ACTN|nr:hypothetical protein GCM10010249_12870 [Streptomyces roseolilacinus]
MGAVLVAGATTPATRSLATGCPWPSVSDSIASMRSSTCRATEDGRPGQVGDAMTGISQPGSTSPDGPTRGGATRPTG